MHATRGLLQVLQQLKDEATNIWQSRKLEGNANSLTSNI